MGTISSCWTFPSGRAPFGHHKLILTNRTTVIFFSGSLQACLPVWGSLYLFLSWKSSLIHARSEPLLFAHMPWKIVLYRSKRPQDAQPPRRGVSTGVRSALVRGIGGGPPTSKFFSFERQRKIKKWPHVYHGALLASLLHFVSSPSGGVKKAGPPLGVLRFLNPDCPVNGPLNHQQILFRA